jgi:hypothetical protein
VVIWYSDLREIFPNPVSGNCWPILLAAVCLGLCASIDDKYSGVVVGTLRLATCSCSFAAVLDGAAAGVGGVIRWCRETKGVTAR